MRNLYISDLHFFHNNVLLFDDRPFETMDEMINEMIKRWNGAVDSCDHVYILGDMFWKNSKGAVDVLKKLKGNLHLIKGNHDKIESSEFKKRFDEIAYYKELNDVVNSEGRRIVLSHYYMPFYNSHYYDGILLHGHSHTTLESYDERKITKYLKKEGYPIEVYNVGCMYPYMDYTPRTLDEIVSGYKEWIETDERKDAYVEFVAKS